MFRNVVSLILDDWVKNSVRTVMSAGMGMLYGSIAGGGLSALGSIFGGGKQQKMWGPTTVELPKYSFTEPNYQLMSDWASQGMQQMQEGQPPWYWKKYMDTAQEGMGRRLKQQYYGKPGETGLFEEARSLGAAMGTGPKGTQAQVNKQFQDYSEKAKQIDEYIQGMGAQAFSQSEQLYPKTLLSIPQGPPAVVATPGGTSQPQSAAPWGDIGGQIGQALPWLMNQNQNTGGAYYGGAQGYGGGSTMPSSTWMPSATSNYSQYMPDYWGGQFYDTPVSSDVSPGMNYAANTQFANWGY